MSTVRLALLLLSLFLLVWLVAFLPAVRAGPSGRSMAGDFALFLAAARLERAGANPYQSHALYRTEVRALRTQHVAVPPYQPFLRVGNPPLTYAVLQPLTRWPFRRVAVLWVLGLSLLLGATFALWLRHLRWRLAGPLLLFLALPQTVLAAYYGNLDAFIFASLGFALLLGCRAPVLAGAVLALTWLKPPVGLPFAFLVLLFSVPAWRRGLAGFGAATLLGLALTVLVTGPARVGEWIHALLGYSRSEALQPDLASLSGLYVAWARPPWATLLGALILLLALGLTLWYRHSYDRPPLGALTWLWLVWFLAAPFGHFHDETPLALPLAAAFQHDPTARLNLATLGLLVGSFLLFPAARFGLDLQSLPLLAAAGLLAPRALTTPP